MAEGDSIARLAARLHAATAGALVVRSTFRHPRWATADLSGQRLTGWHPRGKHLLLRTDAGWTVHSHLRMSGRWSVLGPGKRLPPGLELRAALHLDDGRTLAGIALPVLDLVRTRDEGRVVGHLGPDVLAPGFDPARAAARVRGATGPVIGALLDQCNVAGLGNLWAVELLFLHGVDPWTPAAEVDVVPLLADAQVRMAASVAGAGQVTTGDRRRGRSHWVYGRKGRPCFRCGTPVAFRAAERTPHGRETWWCPSCQSGTGSGAGSSSSAGPVSS